MAVIGSPYSYAEATPANDWGAGVFSHGKSKKKESYKPHFDAGIKILRAGTVKSRAASKTISSILIYLSISNLPDFSSPFFSTAQSLSQDLGSILLSHTPMPDPTPTLCTGCREYGQQREIQSGLPCSRCIVRYLMSGQLVSLVARLFYLDSLNS